MPRNGHYKNKKSVLVIDSNKQFVEYITPAAARVYINKNTVKIWKRNPLVIMLPHGVERVKVYFDKSNSAAKAARHRKKNK